METPVAVVAAAVCGPFVLTVIDCLERGMHDMREMLKVGTGDA